MLVGISVICKKQETHTSFPIKIKGVINGSNKMDNDHSMIFNLEL